MSTLQMLLDALPVIARITGGYASVTDKAGVRIKTVGSDGTEVEDMRGKIFELASHAGESGEAKVGPSQIIEHAEAWSLPVGDYVLAASNLERFQRDEKLFSSLKQALPFIARVAGGEAVLFDADGKRLASVGSDGKTNLFIGKVSSAACEAMKSQRPVIGESMSDIGAVAIRIPITRGFGFGFNNVHGVQKQQKLIEEFKKFQYARYNFSDIVGTSEAIQKVKNMSSFISKGISSILLYGETGTGKELFAQSIHNASDRCSKPFVAINCGAIPASIIESYLFGYEEGAFTGARKSGSPGAFEQANTGTIFLDELSEMDFNLQSKLLRILQEREVTRIGGAKPLRIDVRVIASTNRDLSELVRFGKFREDLFYRLNVVQIKVPPLRERLDDIPDLVRVFINRYNQLMGKFVVDVSGECWRRFTCYTWPGNVRELQNCIEYAMNVIRTNENCIETEHLPQQFQSFQPGKGKQSVMSLTEAVKSAERDLILRGLKITGNSKQETARLLGISTTTLWRKMAELEIAEAKKKET